MLTIRVAAPAALSPAVRAVFEAEPTVSSLTVLPGASIRPAGDIYEADIPRETANLIIEELTEIGVQHEGTIQVTPVPTWISESALNAEDVAPGASADAVVWADVVQKSYDETGLTWTYLSFMIMATLLAAIAILTDSIILVIGAMVLGPEFVAIAALGLALDAEEVQASALDRGRPRRPCTSSAIGNFCVAGGRREWPFPFSREPNSARWGAIEIPDRRSATSQRLIANRALE